LVLWQIGTTRREILDKEHSENLLATPVKPTARVAISVFDESYDSLTFISVIKTFPRLFRGTTIAFMQTLTIANFQEGESAS
jgi:hypothetical protein